MICGQGISLPLVGARRSGQTFAEFGHDQGVSRPNRFGNKILPERNRILTKKQSNPNPPGKPDKRGKTSH
jgi:hypothetical protein